MNQDKLLIYIVAFISLIALVSFFVSPFFKISKIDYQGYDILSIEELNEILQGFYQKNIFLIDSDRLANRLTINSYVKTVNVNKRYPDQLLIIIEERIALAKINNNGKFIFFTGDGYILEEGSMKGKIAVPQIKGLGYTITQNRIAFSPVLEKIVQALSGIDRSSREMINSIQYKENDFTAYLYNIPVLLGSEDELNKKLQILQSLQEKIKKDQDNIEYIDLTILKKPVLKEKK